MDKGSESFVLDVVFGSELFIWLILSLVSLVSLVVNGSINLLSVVENVGNSHSVLSEGSGLVRADARGRSESLDRLKVLDEHHLLGHSLGGKSEGDGNSGEETFWNIGDNDSNGEHEVGDNWVFIDNTEDEEDDSKGDGDS